MLSRVNSLHGLLELLAWSGTAGKLVDCSLRIGCVLRKIANRHKGGCNQPTDGRDEA